MVVWVGKFKIHQICLNSFKHVRPNLLFMPNSLFIRPVYRQKSAGIRWLGISLFIFLIKWISTDFYRIRSIFFETSNRGLIFFISADFLNTTQHTTINTGTAAWILFPSVSNRGNDSVNN
jgi:hypothetical protein